MSMKTNARHRMLTLYIELANKTRHKEEEKIFNMIEEYCLPLINDSFKYYYELHKKHAKVGYKTFYYRHYQCGFNKWDALTMTVKQARRLRGRKHSKAIQAKKELNETVDSEVESDIIRFIKNGIPLSPRQRKYVEETPEFAKRLKKEMAE